jgi:molybdopterin-guanine dinucleotide biosynthesis protein A
MTTNQHMPTAAATSSIGVILAGGKSSRMGTDKAALRIENESLLLRANRTLQDASCNKVILSGHARSDWPYDTIPDLFPGAGPVGGIVSTLSWADENITPDSCLLFIPIDAPLLSSALIVSMLNAAQHGDGCYIEGSPLPVALRTTESVLERCKLVSLDLQANRSWSVRRFTEPLCLTPLDVSEAIRPQLINVNTPAQWEDLRRELENRT